MNRIVFTMKLTLIPSRKMQLAKVRFFLVSMIRALLIIFNLGTPDREQFEEEAEAFILAERLKEERLKAGLT